MRGSTDVAERIADLMVRGDTTPALKLLMDVDDQDRNDVLDAVGRILDRAVIEKQRSGQVDIHKAALDAFRSERLLRGAHPHAIEAGDRNGARVLLWVLFFVAVLAGVAWFSLR